MKKVLLFTLLAASSMTAIARDDVSDYSVEEAMSIEMISSAIGSQVDFYFADQKHNKVNKSFGEFKTNRKTNAFGKSDTEACQWAFASAMKTLRERAVKEGGNAVINIRSNYKGTITSSSTHFKCGAGAVIAGVSLVGDVVTINSK